MGIPVLHASLVREANDLQSRAVALPARMIICGKFGAHGKIYVLRYIADRLRDFHRVDRSGIQLMSADQLGFISERGIQVRARGTCRQPLQ